MPPTLERRISESTPGAILQPQPPPWEKLVRRSGAAPGRAHSAEGSRLMAVGPEADADCLSAPATPRGSRPKTSAAHRTPFARRPEQRLARRALRRQVRGERGVGDEATHQRRQRRGVADRKEAVVVGAEQADVAVDPARQHRHARAHRLDHDVGAALHDARVDQRPRPGDRLARRGVRQATEPAIGRAGRARRPGPRRRAARRAPRRCERWSARARRPRAAGRRASASRDPSLRAGGRRRRTRVVRRARRAAPRCADCTITTALARVAASSRARPSSCSTTTRLAHSSECRARVSWSRSR